MDRSRRHALKLALLSSLGLGASAPTVAEAASARRDRVASFGFGAEEPRWAAGVEGQRKADMGDGRFFNPVLPGDRPDPAILKDGDDYYMTFSSFETYPGLIIWHSQDLVNWVPLGAAITTFVGSCMAVSLCKHNGRYFIYIPVVQTPQALALNIPGGCYVIHADNIRGPWSEPVLIEGVLGIDPGHIVGEDGKRYLFTAGVNRVPLTDDGLKAAGPSQRVYEGWKYPEDWVVEAFALEGPKMLRRGDYFYMVSAEGGTAGPPTGHMVIVARSKSIHGPWENCPFNPIIRTRDRREAWWSRGHATPIEGPNGDWYLFYHGYENGYRTLGRQCLMEPMEWTADGWIRPLGGDLSQPLPSPRGGRNIGSGAPLSDDFSRNRFGVQWSFFKPSLNETQRVTYGDKAVTIFGKGTSPADSSPLTCVMVDRAYEISVDLEVSGAAEGGLLLFLSNKLFIGVGHNGARLVTYAAGGPARGRGPALPGTRVRLKITNDRHVVTLYSSTDSQTWVRGGVRFITDGYTVATSPDGESLRAAIYSAGAGSVTFRDFRYRALA